MGNSKLPDDLRGVHFHFVGIKGTGMVALVEIFFNRGAVITGSDVADVFYTDEILSKLDIKPLLFSRDNITDGVQYVVYSSAYSLEKNPDLIEAVKRKIPCLLYTEALGEYSKRAFSCGVCGVHGKTSTTGLCGTILKELPLPFQVLAGSVINSFGEKCTYTSKNYDEKAKNHYFVAETCEYRRHFLSFFPKIIILTSVETDHQDYYPTFSDIQTAFVEYILKLPTGGKLIYCADDAGALETAKIAKEKRSDILLIPYGENAAGDYHLTYGKIENEKNNFSVDLFGNFSLNVPGKHEALDATAAIALASELLKENTDEPKDFYSAIKNGCEKWSGGKRRSEVVGRFTTKSGNDVIVIDDYGHHPTAIKTTLKGFRDFYSKRKIIVDFMSHTYSRTNALLDEFASSFFDADIVILHKIYASARENIKDFNITGKTLYEKTLEKFNEKFATGEKSVFYFEEILSAKDFVINELNKPLDEKYKNGYLFVTMGAGDNWVLGKEILATIPNF